MHLVLASIFLRHESCKIVSSTPERSLSSRFKKKKCSDDLCLYINAGLFSCLPKQKPLLIIWPPESHFSRRDKLFQDKGFCSRRMRDVPMPPYSFSYCSCIGVPIWTSGSFPACECFDEGSYWCAEWRAKTTGVCVHVRRNKKWMKCVGICVCQARIKYKW